MRQNRWWPLVLLAMLLPLAQVGCAHRVRPLPMLQVELHNGAPRLVAIGVSSKRKPSDTPFTEVLPRAYGSNPYDGTIDLAPGMRLHTQHATLFSTDGPAGPLGHRAVTDQAEHEVVRRRGGLALRLLTAHRKHLGPAAALLEGAPKSAACLRFFYLAYFNRREGKPTRSAVILWANTKARLEEHSESIRANPQLACSDSADCLSIPPETTVSVRIPVQVNGERLFVVVGTTVRDVLRERRGSVELPASLTVQRRCWNRDLPVVWPQGRSEVLQLPLLAGDELRW